MRDPDRREWAEPSSLLGLLQRGRGAGYWLARAEPARATDLVVECITHDPRWDAQVEERGWFYAHLVADLGVDFARLRVAFHEPPSPGGDTAAWLATEVFELTARLGVAGAVTELRSYLRSGRDPTLALEHLLPLGGHDEASGILEELLAAVSVDQLRESLWAVEDLTVAPWPDWRRASSEVEEAVSRVILEREERSSRPSADPAGARRNQTRAVLRRVGAAASPETPASRLTAAAEGDEGALLEVGPGLLDDSRLSLGERAAIRRSLWDLTSPAALSWARATAGQDSEAGYAATHLLARRGGPGDLPVLRRLLDQAISDGTDAMYAQCDLVEGLSRLHDAESVPRIETLFDTTVYSALRRRCAVALRDSSDGFRSARAIECLWDCESSTRMAAIPVADRASDVLHRLTAIAEDPIESEDNRRAVLDDPTRLGGRVQLRPDDGGKI